jgi:transposase
VDTDTGEFQEKRLAHREEAEKFYRAVTAEGQAVRVGMEASGHGRWFERLLAELQIELWVGDAAEIRAKRVRQTPTFSLARTLPRLRPTGIAWAERLSRDTATQKG